ncbi:ubiquitin E2 variant, partial [Glomus cerebriforme]
YVHPDRVFRDVDATLAVFKALVPKTDIYTYDDGTVQVLLCLHGTIPITFRSTPYNIPVAFWIPTDYPMVPPIAFVVPTSSMLVRKSQHVDVSGRCSHHYLEHWNPPPHNEVCLNYLSFIIF